MNMVWAFVIVRFNPRVSGANPKGRGLENKQEESGSVRTRWIGSEDQRVSGIEI
ncbi:hypothetical protein PAXRUDRAFT_19668 [Paxillus rubicundulus Ve08.2h10]|uniref:Uncharacterized protein n=1 Tax=Paxillus rubicundulus Ve08.2h10 TaxID=930991 RepID=A0A0D0DBJ9_9AGAM|nr:hypothetical protein PAXRUDRAFT_19668 [Paxillus rubicundulus Ve08.2h10]